jgi:hypothetical protein
LLGELENLKIKTRLIDEKFVGVMGDLEVMGAQSILIIIRKAAVLARARSTLLLSCEEKVA